MLLAPLCGIFLGEGQSETLGAWLLLISAFLFGLPHGACDFWILQKTVKNQTAVFQTLSIYFLVYLALSLTTVAIWIFLPNLALVGFLLLTAWHFGSGDAIWEKENSKLWQLNGLGRGLIIIFAPITFHAALSGKVLTGLTGNTGGEHIELILNVAPYLLTTGIFALVVESILTKAQTDLRSKLIKWTEIGLILIMFWLTSPILAVTFYLVGVHSWRHILRLEVYAEGSEKTSEETEIWQIILNFHKKALPITVLALFGLAGILWVRQIGLNDIFQMTYGYLILLSALTVPHAALIYWIESRNSFPMISTHIQ